MSALGRALETMTIRPGWGFIGEAQHFLLDRAVFIFNEAEDFGELSHGPSVTAPIEPFGRRVGLGILCLWN